LQAALVVITGFAFLAALLAWSRGLAGRRWAAAGHLLLAALLGPTVLLGWPFVRYLETFEAGVPELAVAEVFFERVGPGRYRVAVTHLPAGRIQVVELAGDEWRLDLSVLDWSDRAIRLGSTPRHRIEAILSRPGPAEATGLPLGITARLAATEVSAPWLAGLGASRGTPLTATRPVTSPWLPMAHGARFDVRRGATGLAEVEPLNVAAEDALAAR
jgi:hypothetical protein